MTRLSPDVRGVTACGYADASLTLDGGPTLALAAELVARGAVWVRGCGNSMAPTICDGDMVLLRRFQFQALRRGDVVVVASSHAAVLHRIERVVSESSVETIGDARLVGDGLNSRDNVLAIAVLAERGRLRIALRSTFEFGLAPYARGRILLARLWLARHWRRARGLLRVESI